MADGAPDELYTLRAQYWLGHANSAVQEAKSVARRPMAAALKEEREEYLFKAYIAMRAFDKCVASPGDGVGLQALALKAQFEAATGNPSKQGEISDAIKSLAATAESSGTVQLVAAQVCLALGEPSTAYSHANSSNVTDAGAALLELRACKLQILLQLDRLDLALSELTYLQSKYDESVLTELSSVYVNLYQGSSQADAAEHTLNALSEQYGPSVLLLNLLATAHAVAGDYAAAETKLGQCVSGDFPEVVVQHETHANLVCVLQQQHKQDSSEASLSALLQTATPTRTSVAFAEGLNKVTTAFDREAIKYKV